MPNGMDASESGVSGIMDTSAPTWPTALVPVHAYKMPDTSCAIAIGPTQTAKNTVATGLNCSKFADVATIVSAIANPPKLRWQREYKTQVSLQLLALLV